MAAQRQFDFPSNAQLWELIGSLPRQKAIVDHLVSRFFAELNPTFDSVHEETFGVHYDKFWDRKTGQDDLESIDIRWLAVLFIILAFGELLDCPQPCSAEAQRETEDSSLHFYWASRKSLVIAPSFYGESTDLVRAGILITRYLIYARRISESWLTISFAVRMAQAQGMHVDGEHLELPRKVVETRRRLWAQLYNLDRCISLALGRPYATNDHHCNVKLVENVWVDNMTNEEAVHALPMSLENPTPSVLIRFQHQLAVIIGRIQEQSFSFTNSSTISQASYNAVLGHDEDLMAWKNTLPSYFRLDNPDTSLDSLPAYPYLSWHRLYLHAGYHFARVTLHRSYLLRPSITDRFRYSRIACLNSACADLKLKLGFRHLTMATRLKSNIAAHQLFNSALILGIIVVRDPYAPNADGILEDLQAYCDKLNADSWVNEAGLAEVRVVELCVARARKARGERASMDHTPEIDVENMNPSMMPEPGPGDMTNELTPAPYIDQTQVDDSLTEFLSNPAFFFPETMDYQIWEGLVDDLAPGNGNHFS